MTTTFFPAFGSNRVANVANLVVNGNPATFFFRVLALTAPELVAPLGGFNDAVLELAAPDSLLDSARRVSVPLQVGDRVRSANRQVAGSELFGGYILAFVPGTSGAIVVWDGGFLTYDPLSDLEPQRLSAVRRTSVNPRVLGVAVK